jgi:PPE-repeat protein
MTAPMWMAAPPEVHSTLLSSGPGPGSLLAASEAWTSLGVAYTEVADELSSLMTTVQAGVWEGPSAESYASANLPFLAWLLQNSANSAAMAAEQKTAAAAYTSALATMPTLPELAANHATHAALVATNFFGINTIPIAVNEADYARMWIQAATTMSTYHAVSTASVAAAPQPAAAPQIAKADTKAESSDVKYQSDSPSDWLYNLINQFAQQDLGYNPPDFLPKNPLDPLHAQYPNVSDAQAWANIVENFNTFVFHGGELTPGQPLAYDLGKGIFFFNYATHTFLPHMTSQILHGNLSQIFSIETLDIAFAFISMRISNIFEIVNVALNSPLAWVGAAGAFAAPLPLAAPLAVAPVGAVGGFAGLAGLAGLAGVAPPAVAPVATSPVIPPSTAATAPAPASAPAAASTPGAPPPPGGGALPPSVTGPGMGAAVGTGMENFAATYLVGGFPAAAKSSSRSKTAAPSSDKATTSAPATAAATEEEARTRRRRRAKAKTLGRGYEYMDLDQDLDTWPGVSPDDPPAASTGVSDQGSGPLGFAGATPKSDTEQAAGLTTLGDADEAYGGGPRLPMMPGTWGEDPDSPDDRG